MMKEKKKGLLQRGIMVAVSALTIVAGAGTVLAYEPMPSSDKSVIDFVAENEENSDMLDFSMSFLISNLKFTENDTVFFLRRWDSNF